MQTPAVIECFVLVSVLLGVRTWSPSFHKNHVTGAKGGGLRAGGGDETTFGYVKKSLKAGYNCQIYQTDSLFTACDKAPHAAQPSIHQATTTD